MNWWMRVLQTLALPLGHVTMFRRGIPLLLERPTRLELATSTLALSLIHISIHRPATEEGAFAARRRLIYEELLVLQLGIGRMKNRGSAATGAPMQPTDPEPFWEMCIRDRPPLVDLRIEEMVQVPPFFAGDAPGLDRGTAGGQLVQNGDVQVLSLIHI